MSSIDSPAPSNSRTILNHPPGLFVLFGTEMSERISYYGMRALLILYLTNHLKYERADALSLYGIYTGMVYLTPLLGGVLADAVLGQRKAIFIGGLLMALGHFTMAFEEHLYFALGLIVLGNGFFKPNISTMVGQLYTTNDPRRDNAYSIFYMGINLGAFIAPLISGTLGESKNWGWHWGFGFAGVAMVLSLIMFALFQGTLGKQGYPPNREDGPTAGRLTFLDIIQIVLITAIGAGMVYLAVKPAPRMLPVLGYWFILAAFFGLITALLTGKKRKAATEPESSPKPAARQELIEPFTWIDGMRVVVIVVVSVFSILFWMGFEQAGGTFSLFADKLTDRTLPAFLEKIMGRPEFPASWYQTINPLLIVLLAPIVSLLWAFLDRVGLRLNSATKMGLGLVILGLGFIVMNYANRHASPEAKAGPHWLAIVYLFNSVGELCVSPVGLSLVNKLAHPRISSFMMALWFTCTAIASYLAATMEALLESPMIVSRFPNLDLFSFLIFSSIVPGIILVIASPLLKKLSYGRL